MPGAPSWCATCGSGIPPSSSSAWAAPTSGEPACGWSTTSRGWRAWLFRVVRQSPPHLAGLPGAASAACRGPAVVAHPDRFPGVQHALGAHSAAPRHFRPLLHQPADLGVAPLPHQADRRQRRRHGRGVPLRGGPLQGRGGGRGFLRRSPAGGRRQARPGPAHESSRRRPGRRQAHGGDHAREPAEGGRLAPGPHAGGGPGSGTGAGRAVPADPRQHHRAKRAGNGRGRLAGGGPGGGGRHLQHAGGGGPRLGGLGNRHAGGGAPGEAHGDRLPPVAPELLARAFAGPGGPHRHGQHHRRRADRAGADTEGRHRRADTGRDPADAPAGSQPRRGPEAGGGARAVGPSRGARRVADMAMSLLARGGGRTSR